MSLTGDEFASGEGYGALGMRHKSAQGWHREVPIQSIFRESTLAQLLRVGVGMAGMLGNLFLGPLSVALVMGCSSGTLSTPEVGGATGNDTSNFAMGGARSAGGMGSVATGGAMLAIGGKSPTGGNPGAGGSVATGGNPGAGGSMATGGNPGAGGSMATGGNPGAGGSRVNGGSSPTGGSSNLAGTAGSVGASVAVSKCGRVAKYPCYECDPLPVGSTDGCAPVGGCDQTGDSSSTVRYPDSCFVLMYEMNPWYPNLHQSATCNASKRVWNCQL